jgi:hypothetical protein
MKDKRNKIKNKTNNKYLFYNMLIQIVYFIEMYRFLKLFFYHIIDVINPYSFTITVT